MKLEALKNQHREMEFEMQMRSDEILAKEVGESRATIQRLIRITKLISPFRDLLDYECMTFGVAYVFAGCDPVGQDMLYCFFHENNVYPNLEQAKALQKLWESNTLTIDNVKKSIFTNLLYCGDCGHKLWFNINKQNPSIRFYSCSNYKGLRGTCESTHYVREDSLEQVVKIELFKLATYLDHDENAFAELLEHKKNKDSMAERKAAESALAAATARSQELLRLYERVYEDNVNGKVTDDWFMRLSHKYEVEQEELKKQMFDLKNKIERLDTAQNSSGSFIRAIRKFMTMQVLTPVVLQELIDKIEVFPIEGTGKNRTQRLVIHYRFVGCIDLPSIVPKHTYKLDSRQGVAIEYLPSAV